MARLATIDPDGRPHLVPIVFALAGDTLYSAVDRKPKRSQRLQRIENARARPDVTILVDHYEDHWSRLWWIRLRGRARVLDGDTFYSAVDRKPKRSSRLRRIENARARPEVTILVDHYEEDWSRLWWIRLRGRARVLDDGPERERALALLAEKYPQYRAEPPEGPVLAVDVTEVREWRAEGA